MEGEIGADVGFRRNLRDERREELRDLLGGRVVLGETGPDEAHPARGIAVVQLREDELLGCHGGPGRVLAAGFAVDVRHGGDVVEDAVVRRDALELREGRFARHERILHVEDDGDFHFPRLHLTFEGGDFLDGGFVGHRFKITNFQGSISTQVTMTQFHNVMEWLYFVWKLLTWKFKRKLKIGH